MPDIKEACCRKSTVKIFAVDFRFSLCYNRSPKGDKSDGKTA